MQHDSGIARAPGQVAIRRACTEQDVASFRELVLEYFEYLGCDLTFQARSMTNCRLTCRNTTVRCY